MRKEFSSWLEAYAAIHPEFIFLTGDLGFQAFENVQKTMQDRFVNMGVAEQNMVSVAAGLAQQSLRVACYSIAPFAVFRPCEQIRLDVCLHNKDVKIVGNGGGYGYGIMGATHHALEDIATLSSFQNMVCYVPFCNEEVGIVSSNMMDRVGPAYLRLGFGIKPPTLDLPKEYDSVRKLMSGTRVTIVGMGPVLLNAVEAAQASGISADVFVVSEFPINNMGKMLEESIRATGKLLIVEEHVRRGGLGEMLAFLMLQEGITARIQHQCAQGYPNGLYGSQKYHQALSGLNSDALAQALVKLTG